MASIVFIAMLIPLLIISEYLFLEPYVLIYVPYERGLGFFLIIAVSAVSGVVLAMNVYRIKALRNSSKKIGGGVLGSIIGASAGACGCGPIGFTVVSTFGTVGGIATSFLSNYEIPLRLAALGILAFVFYTTSRSLSVECKIKG